MIKSQTNPDEPPNNPHQEACPLCKCKREFKSNSNEVTSSSNKFLNPNSDLNTIPISKQVIINTYSSFSYKFKLSTFKN